jgi:hypothetical protein
MSPNSDTLFWFLANQSLLFLLNAAFLAEKQQMGDLKKNEDFSFSENNLNIKWYERKVNILKQAIW